MIKILKFSVFSLTLLVFNGGGIAQGVNNFPSSGNVGIYLQDPRDAEHDLCVGIGSINRPVDESISILAHNKVAVGYRGQSSGTILFNEGDVNKHGIYAYNYNSNTYLPLYVGDGQAHVLLAHNGGFVGVGGIETPMAQLHVNSNALITSNGNASLKMMNWHSGNKLEVGCNNNYGFLNYDNILYFKSSNFGSSSLSLHKNGVVVIGADIIENTPLYQYDNQGFKLAVNGGILCEEVKVINDVPASDYVFEEDYKLMSLEELESFVDNNKHLPEVPSAQEFKDNGYSIGEMDDLLLRKVEELTLYIIAQQKEIEALRIKVVE